MNSQKHSISKRDSLRIVLVILALVLISGAAAYVSLRIFSKPASMPEKPITESIPPKVPIQTEVDQTSDWKTYRNEEYRFEMKYPNNWILESYGSAIKVFSSEFKGAKRDYPFILINIRPNAQKLSIKEFYGRSNERNLFFQSNNEYTQGQIGGKTYYRFAPYITFAGEVVVVVCLDLAFIEIQGVGPASQGRVFDTMLSSFRFE